MGILRTLIVLLLAVIPLGSDAQTRNPFGTTPAAPAAKPQTCSVETPGFLTRTAPQIIAWQRQLNEQLSAHMRAYKESGALYPVLAILLISFLYGVFHAVGPGHGKVVAAAYFAANRAHPTQGLAMTGMISLVQALSAILLVGILAVLFSFDSQRINRNVTYLEAASHGLILLVGLYIAYGGLVGRGCSHGHAKGGDSQHSHVGGHHDHHHHHRVPAAPAPTADIWSMSSAAIAAGIRPCTGAILVLLFTLSHGIFGVGVLSALVMALGVFMVLAALGLGVIYARRSLTRAGSSRAALADTVHRAAGMIGGLLIVVLGGLLLLGSLASLGVCL